MGTSWPRLRSIGGEPEVRWRSDAFCLTTSIRMSEKSKFMGDRCIGRARGDLKGGSPATEDAAAAPASTGCGDARRGCALARACDAGDLGDRGQAAADLLEAVLAEAHHALVHGGVRDVLGRLAGDRHAADRLRDPHDLVEADPALVARAAAARAAHGLVRLEVEADVEAVGAHHVGADHRAALALLT